MNTRERIVKGRQLAALLRQASDLALELEEGTAGELKELLADVHWSGKLYANRVEARIGRGEFMIETECRRAS